MGEPTRTSMTIQLALRILHLVHSGITEADLERAKNLIKSQLLLNLESRAVRAEDIARQYLAGDVYYDSRQLCELLDNTTLADVKEAVKKMMTSNVAVAALGSNVRDCPTAANIQRHIDQTYRFE